MKLRRANELIVHWTTQGPEVCHVGERVSYRLSSGAMELLIRAGEWVGYDELLSATAAASGSIEAEIRPAIDTLIRLGLLADDNCSTADESEGTPWDYWGAVARHFHGVTKNANYPESVQERTQLAQAINSDGTAEPLFKEYASALTLYLPRVRAASDLSLTDVLHRRRTHRDFTSQPVSIDNFAAILAETWGPQRFINADTFGVQQLRSSPSAGGRHEVECYVGVFNVTGVPVGLYHYNAVRHALELLDASFDATRAGSITYGQRQCVGAAFTCFTTARIRRLAWKYRHPRAYRLVMYDAGHYGQTFALITTALGLGPFQTAAFLDTGVERALGISPDEEFPVYVLGAGHPAPGDGSLPSDYRYPEPVRRGEQ